MKILKEIREIMQIQII